MDTLENLRAQIMASMGGGSKGPSKSNNTDKDSSRKAGGQHSSRPGRSLPENPGNSSRTSAQSVSGDRRPASHNPSADQNNSGRKEFRGQRVSERRDHFENKNEIGMPSGLNHGEASTGRTYRRHYTDKQNNYQAHTNHNNRAHDVRRERSSEKVIRGSVVSERRLESDSSLQRTHHADPANNNKFSNLPKGPAASHRETFTNSGHVSKPSHRRANNFNGNTGNHYGEKVVSGFSGASHYQRHSSKPLQSVPSPSNDETAVNWDLVKSIEELRKRYNITSATKWDVPADGFRDVSVQQVKEMHVFSTPDEIIRRNTYFNYKQNMSLDTGNSEASRGRQMQKGPNNSNMNVEIVNNEDVTAEIIPKFYETELNKLLIFNFDPQEYLGKFCQSIIVGNDAKGMIPAADQWKVEYIKQNDQENFVVKFSNKFMSDAVLLTHTLLKPEASTHLVSKPDAYTKDLEKHIKNWVLKGSTIASVKKDAIDTDSTKITFSENSPFSSVVLEFVHYEHFFNPTTTINSLMNKQCIPRAPSCVLVLYNCIDPVELKKQEVFDKILSSFKNQKSGILEGMVGIEIPRPPLDYIHTNTEMTMNGGLGKVFIKFESIEKSLRVFKELQGWKFQNRRVLVQFYSQADFDNGIFL
ncbi:hypothetical protein ACO0QE_002071 [Hanseniaspora vineae]